MMDIQKEVNLLKKSIENANKTIREAQRKIITIQSECSHESIKVDKFGSADCNICGKIFDWYCPTSPTLECDYEQEDGNYNYEYCRYCGNPEERK